MLLHILEACCVYTMVFILKYVLDGCKSAVISVISISVIYLNKQLEVIKTFQNKSGVFRTGL